MDDRGRLAQSVNGLPRPDDALVLAGALDAPAVCEPVHDRWSQMQARLPRGAGTAGVVLLILASLGYGLVKGDHLPGVMGVLENIPDQVASRAGFRITSLVLSGNHHVSREEMLAGAGITGQSSLLFVDLERARERLKANPWIADASLLKLYPGELQIVLRERTAYALWQKDWRVSVIAEDGTVLEPYVAPRLTELPLVVGSGANLKAREFLLELERHPSLRALVLAAVLVGERRWNLRLQNGLDVWLPEADLAAALNRLVLMERDKNLITRDIAVIDLRLLDRPAVRLSEAAAQARAEAAKDKMKKKGGSA